MKRIFDIAVALTILMLFVPGLMAISGLIWVFMGSPVLFRQLRPGKNARLFVLYKFRTMLDSVGKDGQPLPDKDRLTSLGSAMRRLSLDELPQLLNVLKGDMSLVGPRPLLVEYLPLYNTEQNRRHLVRPGITGWAQVNGRNAISWDERFRLDVWYVDHQSFLLDLKIIGLTLLKVIRSEGISEAGQATMSKFTGNSKNGSRT